MFINLTIYLRVQVAQSLDVTKVAGRVLVSGLESDVVVFDDGVEQGTKDRVRIGVGGVDADARVQVLESRLDDVEQSRTQAARLVLQAVENIASQILLQQRVAVGGILKLLVTGLQLFNGSGINHLVTRSKNSARQTNTTIQGGGQLLRFQPRQRPIIRQEMQH